MHPADALYVHERLRSARLRSLHRLSGSAHWRSLLLAVCPEAPEEFQVLRKERGAARDTSVQCKARSSTSGWARRDGIANRSHAEQCARRRAPSWKRPAQTPLTPPIVSIRSVSCARSFQFNSRAEAQPTYVCHQQWQPTRRQWRFRPAGIMSYKMGSPNGAT